MPRLLGYFASQIDRVRCVLTAEEGARLEPDAREGFGIGSHQGSEVLLRRSPTGTPQPLDLVTVAGDLRTGSFLAHVRRARVGGRTPDNTQPFRLRQWLFAALGTLPLHADGKARLLAEMPGFLANSLRGETDSELLFHHLIGAIFRAGLLDDPAPDRTALRDAITASLRALDAILGETAPLALMLSDGQGAVGYAREMPMRWVRRHGIARCAVCSRRDLPVDHETLRYVLVTDGEPEGGAWRPWGTEEGGGMIVVDRNLEVREARWLDLP
jgi:hypothetical protein